MMGRPLKTLAYLLVAVCISSAVFAGPWFMHKFGELRSYHGAWLNVCQDRGQGPCRATQSYVPKGTDRFFGQSKLTVHIESDGKHSIEVYDAKMPALKDVNITFQFDGETIEVDQSHWQLGERGLTNVMETIYLPPSDMVSRLIELIRAKRTLLVTYPIASGKTGEAPFSLSGSSAALGAIEAHIERRK